MAKLTPKQELFVQEYLCDLNATRAAIRAGYSEKTAKEVGYENLTKPHIAEAVSEAAQKRSERTEVTQDWVIKTLVSNVERAMQAEPVLDREGNETGEYTYQGAVANKALELVGKHLGMFKERHEHSGPDGGPIETRERKTVADEIREVDRNIRELDAEIAALEAGAGTPQEGGA